MKLIPPGQRINFVGSLPFILIHGFAVVGLFVWGWSWWGFALAILLYYVRMFAITAGYHRYFAHRSYKTGRVFQFLLAFLAQTSAQKGALWWASHHRVHHKFSDAPGDIHSAKLDGFFWSHVGWILTSANDKTDYTNIRDFAKYPELVTLNRYHLIPPTALAVWLYWVGGFDSLFWGFFVSTVLLWHGTFTINSLTHMIGKRRYATSDESRNHWLLAIITCGEGWHNNHHYYQRAVNQGFFWWEWDLSYYVLWALSKVGIVWDLHVVPKSIREGNLIQAKGSSESIVSTPVAAPDVAQPAST